MPKKQSKQSYTYDQVVELMWYALTENDHNTENAMQGLEEDTEFQKQAKENNYTPMNWLYYAQDDITHRKSIAMKFAFEEVIRRNELKDTAQRVIDLIPSKRKAELLKKGKGDKKWNVI